MYKINSGTEETPVWTMVHHIMKNGQYFVYKVENGINICRRKK